MFDAPLMTYGSVWLLECTSPKGETRTSKFYADMSEADRVAYRSHLLSTGWQVGEWTFAMGDPPSIGGIARRLLGGAS